MISTSAHVLEDSPEREWEFRMSSQRLIERIETPYATMLSFVIVGTTLLALSTLIFG